MCVSYMYYERKLYIVWSNYKVSLTSKMQALIIQWAILVSTVLSVLKVLIFIVNTCNNTCQAMWIYCILNMLKTTTKPIRTTNHSPVYAARQTHQLSTLVSYNILNTDIRPPWGLVSDIWVLGAKNVPCRGWAGAGIYPHVKHTTDQQKEAGRVNINH